MKNNAINPTPAAISAMLRTTHNAQMTNYSPWRQKHADKKQYNKIYLFH